MKVIILQHSDGTPPGSVLQWARERDLDPDVRQLHKGDALPTLSELQIKAKVLFVLGGPMNVDDLDLYPWLRGEKELLRSAIGSGITCVGLCLGGQLIAQTLGARVEKNRHWEVGWQSVELEATKESLTVFQWHQDMFGLPAGAVRLATNAITENQAFLFSDHVLGFQFHPEATEEWVRECAEDKPYPSGPYVQNAKQALEGLKHLPVMRTWFFSQLDQLLGLRT